MIYPALAASPARIVSTCPAVTEILFHLGAGDRVVGISYACDHPPEALALPRVADLKLVPEKILAREPDLVVAMKGLRGGEADLLGGLGIAVMEMDLSSLDALEHSIARLAAVLGVPEAAAAFAARFAAERAAGARAAARGRPRVFVETWGNPLMTSGGPSFVTGLVELAGGASIFSGRADEHLQVTQEEVLLADPEVILVAWPEDPARVAARDGFAGTAAARSGRVFRIDPDLIVRPGPRLLDGAAALRALFHPGADAAVPETPDAGGKGTP